MVAMLWLVADEFGARPTLLAAARPSHNHSQAVIQELRRLDDRSADSAALPPSIIDPWPMPDPDSVPPKFTKPQLSLLVETPAAGPDWAHELKYDGYCIHARLMRDDVRLLT
jgi:ATP-dependent DNA ligase